jgi:hypothetical protein
MTLPARRTGARPPSILPPATGHKAAVHSAPCQGRRPELPGPAARAPL